MADTHSTDNSALRGIQTVDVVLRNIPGSLLVVHAFAEKAKTEKLANTEFNG